MKIGNHEFDTKNETYIMGILNVTPDSFSDGGRFNHMDDALRHAEAMIADGAAIVDIAENPPDRDILCSLMKRKLPVLHRSSKQSRHTLIFRFPLIPIRAT